MDVTKCARSRTTHHTTEQNSINTKRTVRNPFREQWNEDKMELENLVLTESTRELRLEERRDLRLRTTTNKRRNPNKTFPVS